jgi:hypothetical protein
VISYKTEDHETPKKLKYQDINPTKKYVEIKSASAPFYISMQERFDKNWRLYLKDPENNIIDSINPNLSINDVDNYHFELNGIINGWYINPKSLCDKNYEGCKKNTDGSYDIALVAEFMPQRWFYAGVIVSGIAIIGCASYLIWLQIHIPKKLTRRKMTR